jgi:hypothetical protein
MLGPTDDVRIVDLRPLLPPAILMEEFAIGEAEAAPWSSVGAGISPACERRS